MKKQSVLLCLACLLVGCAADSSQKQVQSKIPGLRTPQPTYPVEGYARHAAGEGTCHVDFDVSGHVTKASMIKSIGSKILDTHTIEWARVQWTGPANTAVNVPVVYVLMPKPPYPEDARLKHVSGAGMCVVVFDAKGKPARVRMIRSTGSMTLDENTVQFGLKNWYGPANQMVRVPIVYRLRH